MFLIIILNKDWFLFFACDKKYASLYLKINEVIYVSIRSKNWRKRNHSKG